MLAVVLNGCLVSSKGRSYVNLTLMSRTHEKQLI